MQTQELAFFSDGLRLDGILQRPEGLAGGECRPAIVLCSGFQGLKELIPAKLWGPLTAAGFSCFSFDYRGIDTSDGERGRVLPREQVEDVRNAITFVQQPGVDPERIGLVGWGFGGGVVVQAAAEDVVQRVRGTAKASDGLSELRTTYGGRSTVPDVAFYRWERIPITETGEVADDFFTPPDIAVEILSPEQSVSGRVRRCAWYVANGVAIGFLVNPIDRSVTLFRNNRQPQVLQGEDHIGLRDVLPGFVLTVADLFALLRIR